MTKSQVELLSIYEEIRKYIYKHGEISAIDIRKKYLINHNKVREFLIADRNIEEIHEESKKGKYRYKIYFGLVEGCNLNVPSKVKLPAVISKTQRGIEKLKKIKEEKKKSTKEKTGMEINDFLNLIGD